MPDPVALHLKHIAVPFEIKQVSEAGAIEGYASVFGVVDSDGDIIHEGAFSETLRNRTRSLPMLWQHDARAPIGTWDEWEEDRIGLKLRGSMLVDDVQQAKEARALAKAGALGGLSVGFMIQEYRISDEDGRRGLDIFKADLWETSLVTFPANAAAQISSVKAALAAGRMPTKREVEALLTQDAGLTRSQARAFLKGGFDALVDATQDAGEEDDAELLAAVKAAILDIKGA
jgi:hypothetical protein